MPGFEFPRCNLSDYTIGTIEKRRSELISKSKSSDNYAISNQYRGRNRWERRKYSRISTSVADYNKIEEILYSLAGVGHKPWHERL